MSQLGERPCQPGDWEEQGALCVALPWRRGKGRAGTSRMSREIHVRICGRLEVQFLRSTRRRLDGKGECQVVAPRGREYRGETQGRTTP
jgi:hypothetical protein